MKKTLGIGLLLVVAFAGVAFAAAGHVTQDPAGFFPVPAGLADRLSHLTSSDVAAVVDAGPQGALSAAEADVLAAHIIKVSLPNTMTVVSDDCDAFVFGVKGGFASPILYERTAAGLVLVKRSMSKLPKSGEWTFVDANGAPSLAPTNYVLVNKHLAAGATFSPVFAMQGGSQAGGGTVGGGGGGCNAGAFGLPLLALAGLFLATRKK